MAAGWPELSQTLHREPAGTQPFYRMFSVKLNYNTPQPPWAHDLREATGLNVDVDISKCLPFLVTTTIIILLGGLL